MQSRHFNDFYFPYLLSAQNDMNLIFNNSNNNSKYAFFFQNAGCHTAKLIPSGGDFVQTEFMLIDSRDQSNYLSSLIPFLIPVSFPLLTEDTTARDYYRSFPLMDQTYCQSSPTTFQPIAFHSKEKPFLLPPEIHFPVTNTITPSQIPKSKISRTNTQPLISISAFQAWESSKSPAQHHVSLTGQPQPSMSQPNNRGHIYLNKFQFRTETLPELMYQPLGYKHSPQALPKHKGLHTNSKTEVTV